ncbi:MAG: hypothetical protein QM610_08100 [Chitinophagaceae bacterium]
MIKKFCIILLLSATHTFAQTTQNINQLFDVRDYLLSEEMR